MEAGASRWSAGSATGSGESGKDPLVGESAGGCGCGAAGGGLGAWMVVLGVMVLALRARRRVR